MQFLMYKCKADGGAFLKIILRTTRNRLYSGITKFAEKTCTNAKKRKDLKLEAAVELFREMLGA